MEKKGISRRRFIKTASAAAAAASTAQIFAPAILRAQQQPIKIGHLVPLTGFLSPMGDFASKAGKLAIEEINAAGGVLGRQIEIVFYDGKSDATVIGNAATQLAETDKVVAMMGFSDSDMALAAAPIAAKANIAFVTSGATSPKLPDQVPDYLLAPGERSHNIDDLAKRERQWSQSCSQCNSGSSRLGGKGRFLGPKVVP